jgi:Ca2+-binding RTX toxin-like protein
VSAKRSRFSNRAESPSRRRRRRKRPTDSPRRLLFEPLEPRLLLNADGLVPLAATMASDANELTLRLDAAAQTLQLVDDLTAVVVAEQALAQTSRVEVVGSEADDRLTLDATVPASLAVFFEGDTGSDTIVGPNADRTWNVTGEGSGSLAGLTFSGIENLSGGSGADVFVFDGGSVAATSGGGGADTLDLSADTTGVVVDLSDGTASYAGDLSGIESVVTGSGDDTLLGALRASGLAMGAGTDTLDFAGVASDLRVTVHADGRLSVTDGISRVERIAGVESAIGGTGSDTLAGPNTGATWNVTGPDAGSVAGVTFSGFENLAGGFGADVFAFDGGSVATASGGWGSADTLIGPDADTTWEVTGPYAGSVAGVAFSGFENLAGRSGADVFAFAGGSVDSTFGGWGADTLDLSADTAGVVVDLAAGSASYAGRISRIESVVAGSADDTLIGPAADITWNITGPDAGGLGGIAFSGFENLTGAADNADTFIFSEAGSLSGLVAGGAAGFDTLEIQGGSYATVTYRPDGSDSGTLDLDGSVISFAGMEPVDLTGTNAVTDLVFDLNGPIDPVTNTPSGSTNDANQIRLRDADSAVLGTMKIVSDIPLSQPGSFEEVVFDNPQSISIDAAGGNDRITIESLDPNFSGSITLKGGNDDDTYAFVAADFGNVTITETMTGGDDTVDFSGYQGDFSAGTISYDDEAVENFVGFDLNDDTRAALTEGLRAFVAWAGRLAESGDLGQPLAGITGNVAVPLGTAIDLADTLRPLVDEIEGEEPLSSAALVTLLSGFSKTDVARLDRAILGDTFAPEINEDDRFTFELTLDEQVPVTLEPITGLKTLTALKDAINTAIEQEGTYAGQVQAVVTGDGTKGRLAFQVLGSQVATFTLKVTEVLSSTVPSRLGLGFTGSDQKIEKLDEILADLGTADVRVGPDPVQLEVDLSTGTPRLTIRFDYLADRSSDFNIDLGSEAESKGVAFESTASVRMDSQVDWALAFQMDLGATPSFEIDVEDLKVSGKVNPSGSQNIAPGTTMDVGFLGAEIQAPGGRLSLQASAELPTTTQWTGLDVADELIENDQDLAGRASALTRTGQIDVDLDIDVKPGLGDFEDSGSAPIEISASITTTTTEPGVFAGDDFEPTFTNFGNIETFANLDAPGFVQLLGKVRDWLDQLRESDLLESFPIPFVEGALSTVADLGDAFGDAILFDDGDDGKDDESDQKLVTDLNKLLKSTSLDGLVQFRVDQGTLVLEAVSDRVARLNLLTPTSDALGFVAAQSSDPAPAESLTLSFAVLNAENTITRASGSWRPSFAERDRIAVTGTVNNDGLFTILAISEDGRTLTVFEEIAEEPNVSANVADSKDVLEITAENAAPTAGVLTGEVALTIEVTKTSGQVEMATLSIGADQTSDNTGVGNDVAKLLDAENTPTFGTAQELKDKLLGLVADTLPFAVEYDADNDRLSYAINLSNPLFSEELPISFDLDLGPVGDVSTVGSPKLTVGGEVGLDLKLVLDLGDGSSRRIQGTTLLEDLNDVADTEDVVKTAPAITAADGGEATSLKDVSVEIGQVALAAGTAVDFSVDKSIRVIAENLINGVLTLTSPANTVLTINPGTPDESTNNGRTAPLRNVPAPTLVAGVFQSPELTFSLRIDQGPVMGDEFTVTVPVKSYSVSTESAFRLRWLPDIEKAIVEAQNEIGESKITLPSGSDTWAAQGFAKGQTIDISDAGVNNGSYEIEKVDGGTLTLVQSLRESEPGVSASIEGPGVLTLQGSDSWSALGFDEGQRITIRGSEQNDGTYLIGAIDATNPKKATLASPLDPETELAEIEIMGDGAQVRPSGDATLTLELGTGLETSITIARDRDPDDPFAPATSDNANLSDLVLDVQNALDAAELTRVEASLDGPRLVLTLNDAAAVDGDAVLAFAAPSTGGFGAISRSDSDGSFLADGFAKGQLIFVQGSDENDGAYRIRDDAAAVTATVLQVEKLDATSSELQDEPATPGIRLSQTFRITQVGGSAETELGFAAGRIANLDDLVVVTSDGTEHPVSLDGATDLDDVIERITLASGGTAADMPGEVFVRINDAGTGLDLVQRPTLTGDPKIIFDSGANTITRLAAGEGGDPGSWHADGFLEDQQIRIGNSLRNSGIFTTAGVSSDGLTLTLAPGQTLFAEGPAKGITVTLAEASENFRVESVNGSPAALRLGILRIDAERDTNDDGLVDQTDGDGVIAGDAIGGQSLLDRLILEDPEIFATLVLDTPAGIDVRGSFGFFDVVLNGNGSFVGTLSLGLNDPTPETDGKVRVTLAELFTEIRERPRQLIDGPTLSGPTLEGGPKLTFQGSTITRIAAQAGGDIGSWIEDGFKKDQLIRVEGAGAADGEYFVEEISDAVLTLKETTFADPTQTISGAEVTGAMGSFALGVTLPEPVDDVVKSLAGLGDDPKVLISLFEAGNPFFERGFTRVESIGLVAGNDSEDPTRDAIALSVAADSSIDVGDAVEVALSIGAGMVQTVQTEIRAISRDRKRLELTTSLADDPSDAEITSIVVSDGIFSQQMLTVAEDEFGLAATDKIGFMMELDDGVEVGDRVAVVLKDAGNETTEADARIQSISADRLSIELDEDLTEETTGLTLSQLTITRPAVTRLEFPDLGGLLDFGDIGFRDILRGLIALSDFLDDFEQFGFLNDEIPLINLSFNDLLLYTDRFAQAVEDAERNPAGSLQTLEGKLEELLGIDDGTIEDGGQDPFDIELDLAEETRVSGDVHKMLRIEFVIGAGFSEGVAVDFDLTPEALDDLLTLNGQAGLNASGDVTFTVALGIDLARTEMQGDPAISFEHIPAPADVTGVVSFGSDQLVRSGGWTGFVEGMLITVAGSDEQNDENDGSYRVAGVSGDVLTLAAGEELSAGDFDVSVSAGSIDRILRSTGSFADDGFLPGQSIHLKGELDPLDAMAGTANTGDYTLAYVGANVVTLRPGDDGTTSFDDASEQDRAGIEIFGARSISIFEDSKLTASLEAAADDITFRGAVGPLGVFVEGGSAHIGAAGELGLDFAGTSTRKLLGDVKLSRDFGATLTGDVTAALPVAFPADSIDRGAVLLDAALDLDPFSGDLNVGGFTPTATDAQGIDIAISDLFDITGLIDLGQLSLFDGVLLAVDGVDLFLGGLQDVLDGEVFGIELPLIGDSLSDGARFIEDLREGFLADFRQGVEDAEDFTEDLQDKNKNILSKLLFDALEPTGLLLVNGERATRQGLENGLFELSEAVDLTTNLDLTQPIAVLREQLKAGDAFMQWDMTLGQSLLDVDTELDIDLGIPGLGFEAEGPLGLKLGWELDFGFGLDLDDGFYFSVDPTREELTVDIDVTLPDRFGGQLAFLQLDALNTGSLLQATFGVDVRAKGNDASPSRLEFGELGRLELDTGIKARAIADFDLELALNSDLLPGVAAVFPTVRADFLLDWGLGAFDDDVVSMTGTVDFDSSAGTIERKDGGNWFADGFQKNQSILVSGSTSNDQDTPGDWVIDSISDDGQTLTLKTGPAADEPGASNVTVTGNPFSADLSGDAIKQGLREVSFNNISLDLGSFISDFIGPVLGSIQDVTQPIQPIVDFLTAPLPVISDIGPPVTLLDIAGVFGNVNPALLKSIAEIITLVNALPSGGDIVIDFGDFAIFDRNTGTNMDVDLTDPDTDLSTVDQPSTAHDFDAKLDAKPPSKQKDFAKKLSKTEGFSFPLLTDPSQIFGLLTGQPVTLMAYDMPALDLELSYTQFFPIYPPLFATVTGEVGAHIDFAFGFDSFGIEQFAKTGFRNPALVFNGFFVSDNPEDGTGSGPDLPELVLTGGLSAGAELNVFIARGGVTGGVFTRVNFDLFDPDRDGKLRVGELLENIETEFKFGKPIQAPLALFDVSGSIFAQLRAFLKFNFLFTTVTVFDEPITPPITIVDFDLDFTRLPKLATIVESDEGDILQLNMGDFAGQRLNGDLSDGSERFKVSGGPDELFVEWLGTPFSGLDGRQSYEGNFSNILALAGAGDDTVDLTGVTGPISFELEGGVGNDVLKGGIAATGGGVYRGGAGDDTIEGSAGEDLIYGEDGNDRILGLGGRDTIFGDGGRLTEGNVTLRRLDLEIIDDGVNLPRIVRKDLASWADDGFEAGQRIELRGSSLADPATGAPGSNGIFKVGEVSDNVLILQELGPDEVDLDEVAGVALNERTERITIEIQNTDHLRAVKGQIGATDGNDLLLGGADDDYLFGSGGDDVLVGDGTSFTDFVGDGSTADGNDVLVADGGEIRFRRSGGIREVADTNRGLAFGDDTLYGSGGHDLLYAGRGDDEAHGGLGKDQIFSEDGFDVAYGGPGADVIFGGNEADTLFGGGEADRIFGGRGGDTIHGGTGDDEISGESGGDLLFGDEDRDWIRGGSEPDVIFGGFGGTDVARTATTEGGGDDLDGGGGDDTVYGDHNPADALLGQISEFFPGEIDASLDVTAAGSLLILQGPIGFSIAPGAGDAGGYAELGFGPGVSTSDAEGRLVALQTLPRDGRLSQDAVVVLTFPGDPAPTEETVSLAAADTADFVPLGGDDLLTTSIGSDFLDGMDGNDRYVVNLRGGENARRFPVFDSGDGGLDPVVGNDQAEDDAKDVDVLTVNGTDFADQLLLRASADPAGLAFVGLLNRADNVERIDYRGIEQLVVNGLGGDDSFAVDDARAITTLDGGPGDDFFQFGQLYKSLRNEAAANISVGDVFATIATTRGFLSDGTTRPMVANGGAGEDEFRVFHNRAVLQINGQGGDDTITVRAFALAGSQDSVQDRTDISGGAGADFIQYAVNAPVNIDGGDGLDTVIVIGTEFADDFVVTDRGVFGAGLNVDFVNVELLKVDGAEGDDRFFIQSTNEDIVTQIVGGLGSDSFNVAGDTPPVISDDLLGHSGIVAHGILTEGIEVLDPLYAGPDGDGIAVEGISANVADIDEPAIVVRESDGATRISEGGLVDSYTIALTRAPRRNVTVTVTAPIQSPEEKARGEFMFGVSPIPFGPGVTAQDSIVLEFTPTNWATAQEVHVHAMGEFDDAALEGERFGVINHLVESTESLRGSLLSNPATVVEIIDGRNVTTTTLTIELDSDMDLDPSVADALRGRTLRITTGAGAGQSLLVRDSQPVQSDRTLQVTLLGRFQEGDLPSVGSGFALDFYQNLQLPSVNVQVDDDDTADVIFTEIGGVTRVAEPTPTGDFVVGAETDRYEVRLAREPRGGDTVVVTVAVKDTGIGADQLLISATADGTPVSTLDLSFTAGSAAQSVYVHALDDTAREGFHRGFLEHSVTTLNHTDVDVLVSESQSFPIPEDAPQTSVLLSARPLEFNGRATSGTETTLVDTENEFDRDLSGYVVRIVRGTGVDLVREIASNTSDTITIVGDWGLDAAGLPLQPDDTSRYQISDVRVTVDPAELAQGTDLLFAVDGRITRTLPGGGSVGKWGAGEGGDGFRIGQRIVISGAGDNDGTYEVTNVTDTVLTVGDTLVETAGPISGVSIEVLERELSRFTVSGSTVILLDAENLPEPLEGVTVRVDFTSLDPGYDGLQEERLSADILDDDTAGVLVTQTDFSTDLIEAGLADAYDVVLTRPPTTDVTIIVTPEETKTTRGGLRNDAVQVGVALAPDVEGAAEVALTFTPATWNQSQRVWVKALQDDLIDGGDTKVFAPMPHTLGGIRGPLVIDGSGGQGSLEGLTPAVVLPGETNEKESTGVVFDAEAGSPDGSTPASLTVFTEELRGALRSGETDLDALIDRTVEITRGDGSGRFARIVGHEAAGLGTAGFSGAVTFDPSGDGADRIVRSTGSWSRDGFTAGQTITLVDNDGAPSPFAGTYTIAEVTALELILEGDLTGESETIDDATVNGEETERTRLILDPGFALDVGESVDGIQAYAITDESVNFFVSEEERIDILTVNDDDSPADANGVLTTVDLGDFRSMQELLPDVPEPGRIAGLGMGPDTRIARADRPGGISFGRLEGLVVNLGLGKNEFNVDAVPLGADEVTGEGELARPEGYRTVTIVRGGGGDDTITVDLAPPTDLVAPLVAIEGQTGNDTIDAKTSSLPLVIFGGLDDDTIMSGSGDDVIFGDRGRVDYFDEESARIVTRLGTAPNDLRGRVDGEATTATTLAVDELTEGGTSLPVADDALVGLQVRITEGKGFGQTRVIESSTDTELTLQTAWAVVPDDTSEFLITGVPSDQTDGVFRDPTLVLSLDRDRGGADSVMGRAGDDLIIGGANPAGFDVLHGDAGEDFILGDNARLDFTPLASAVGAFAHGDLAAAVLTAVRTIDPDHGGDDRLYGGDDDDVLGGGSAADSVDGDAGADLVFGDQVRLVLESGTGRAENPRFRTLSDSTIYDENGEAQVDGTPRPDPDGAPAWVDWVITLGEVLDLGNTGNDYLAGGAGDDMLFGQLGNDTIQGDGGIESRFAEEAVVVGAERKPDGTLALVPSFEAATDGDDYIEGNGGEDVIFGGLGQDDLIGGSSSLFSLDDPSERPDGDDTIFGGAGTGTARNDPGDESPQGHARDADVILGDNGNIFRLLDAEGQFLSFVYDDYTDAPGTQQLEIIPRAVQLLEYTPGGPDLAQADAANDVGGDDELHGGPGDDSLYGMAGDDVLFGDGQDDDLIGGWGHDWMSGGVGTDGLLGDDGRIFTSRNVELGNDPDPFSEVNQRIDTPGNIQEAIIHVENQLKKTVDLTPFNVDPDTSAQNPHFDPAHADDILYGGLGDDFLHGGPGDDAMSGAEALPEAAALAFPVDGGPDPDRTDGQVVVSGYDAPVNPGNALGFEAFKASEFALYDEFDPLRKIQIEDAGELYEFLLNFEAFGDPADPVGTKVDDGNDVLFGDLGNDWMVGGTGQDRLYGGFGADLLNADDNLETNGGANDAPDAPEFTGTNATLPPELTLGADIAYGGAGRDVLVANSGADRLIDWVGEFNSYLVPFGPFGAFTISRAVPPALFDYLYALSAADGADQSLGSDAARNGEPEGELGLVIQKDRFPFFGWQDQTGAPDDPQPGNIPGGARDVLRAADFNLGNLEAFAPDSGVWQVEGGELLVSAESLGGDAVSVFHVDEVLPSYFEIAATIRSGKPTAGWKANAYVIFDYQSEYDFKFAGVNASIDKMQMGRRTPEGWIVDVQANIQAKPGVAYDVLVAVHGTNVTLVVDGEEFFSHTFVPRVIDGYTYGLNWGMVGVGSDNSRGSFDNVRVQKLPPKITFEHTEDFSDGLADLFTGAWTGTWSVLGGRYEALPVEGEDRAVRLVDLGLERGLAAGSILELRVALSTQARGGVVFDYYGPNDFKFAAIDAETGQVVIGHHTAKRGWAIDAVAEQPIDPAADYELGISLKGASVSVSLDGRVVVGHVFNAVVVDGAFGLLSGGGASSFDSVEVRTDDPAFREEEPAAALAAASEAPETLAPPSALTQAELAPILEEAIRRWTEAILPAGGTLESLSSLSVQIADLEGQTLGLASDDTVWIDATAAEHGWFIDATPADDAEFRARTADGALRATPSSPAAGSMDLLSVVMHELGHVLDLDAHELLGATLDTGLRIEPSAVAARVEDPAPARAATASRQYGVRVLAAESWIEEDDESDEFSITEIALDSGIEPDRLN